MKILKKFEYFLTKVITPARTWRVLSIPIFRKIGRTPYVGILLGLFDGSTEGAKSVLSDLEVLLCEGDTDDGNRKNATDDELEDSEEKSAENEEEGVAEGVILEVSLNSLAEGEEVEACHLEALDADGDEDEGDAEKNSSKEVKNCIDKTAEDEPNDIAESTHSG